MYFQGFPFRHSGNRCSEQMWCLKFRRCVISTQPRHFLERIPKRSVWVECWCWVLVSTITLCNAFFIASPQEFIASPLLPMYYFLIIVFCCQPPTGGPFGVHSFSLPAPSFFIAGPLWHLIFFFAWNYKINENKCTNLKNILSFIHLYQYFWEKIEKTVLFQRDYFLV